MLLTLIPILVLQTSLIHRQIFNQVLKIIGDDLSDNEPSGKDYNLDIQLILILLTMSPLV
jgi:hypothetical protein